MSSWQAKSTRALGRNIMEVDGEAAWVKLYEPWSIPHLEEAVSYLRAARNQYGSVLVVIEPFIDNPLPATVRRYLSQHQRDFSFSEIILIKRSVLLRGVATLMHRARILLGGNAPAAPRFVDTPEEASTLLAELRQKHREAQAAR